jgi:hypothetical protein
VSVDDVIAGTGAPLIVSDDVPTMPLPATV